MTQHVCQQSRSCQGTQIVDIVIDLPFTSPETTDDRSESRGRRTAVNITQRDRDLGTAYAMKPSTSRTELTAVGRGTPMGELLRRYWHPVGLATDAGDVPRKVRVLGEDLILFRDRHGRPACSTRAAAIAAPRSITARSRRTASAAAITAGSSTPRAIASNSPASPTAASSGTRCASPGIPLEERYGLIFAYMGPPEKKPVLPRYECAGEDGRRRIRRGRRQLRSAAAAPRSSPATGCSISRTWSTPTTCRCCTARSAGRNSPT